MSKRNIGTFIIVSAASAVIGHVVVRALFEDGGPFEGAFTPEAPDLPPPGTATLDEAVPGETFPAPWNIGHGMII